MPSQKYFLYSLLLSAAVLTGCPENSDGDDAGTQNDDAGTQNDDAGTQNDDAGTQNDDAGTQNDDAGTQNDDAGTQNNDAGTQNNDAGTQNNDAGTQNNDAGPNFVASEFSAQITGQRSPTDSTQDPAVVELLTGVFSPVKLINPTATVPAGFANVVVTETTGNNGDCTPNGEDACVQSWELSMLDDGACQFDGEYTFRFEVSCEAGEDCSRIDPTFTTVTVTANLASENYCDNTANYIPSDYSAQITGQRSPADSNNDPAVVELLTGVFYPIKLMNPTATVPVGFTNVVVTETTGNGGDCTPNGGDVCIQTWELSMLDDGACQFDGDYVFHFEVGCEVGGDCGLIDPSFTSVSIPASLLSENYCF